MSFEFRSQTRFLSALFLAATMAACAHGQKLPKPGQADADKFLFDRGTQYLAKKNWLSAREYFRRIVDSYPQSAYRADAKIGVGDSYLGENHTDTLILAVNEYREFLQFFPFHERGDYVQFHLALAQSKQMLKAERDQTATIDTLKEVQKFIDTYPKSPYRPEVDKVYRQARDRLSESEFRVGLLYYRGRGRGFVAALARFSIILNDDPGYTKKDEVYFYSGEACVKLLAYPQANVYFEKLLAEYPRSKHAKDARKRLEELKKPPVEQKIKR